VLRAFTVNTPELTNRQISERTGLPKPTVSRLTYTLTCLGYLRHLPNAGKYGKYGLGSAVISISYPLLANMTMRQIVRGPMLELAEHAGGWVSMGLQERLSMVYIETARSAAVLTRSRGDIGQTIPIMITAMGRAYLAGLSRPERVALLNEIKVKDAAMWEMGMPGVERALAEFAQRGFCVSDPDYYPLVQAVAVPMRRQRDEPLLVFNCAVPAGTLPHSEVEADLGPRLVGMVRGIERMLEGAP